MARCAIASPVNVFSHPCLADVPEIEGCAPNLAENLFFGWEASFMLSTADLFCVDILPQLLRIGVSSIKIEVGPLPHLCYLATKGYRAAVERAERGETELMTPRERELLEVAFNRGFSPGYLGGDQVMQRRSADSRGLPLGTARSRGREVWLPTTDLRDGDGITFYRGSYKVGGFEVKNPRQDGLGIVVSSPFRLEMENMRSTRPKIVSSRHRESHLSGIPAKRPSGAHPPSIQAS